jgi:hypothetical protein
MLKANPKNAAALRGKFSYFYFPKKSQESQNKSIAPLYPNKIKP